MGCCGEPNDGNDATNRPIQPYNGTVGMQPGPQLMLEKGQFQPGFQQPIIASPPPAFGVPNGQQQYNQPFVNATGAPPGAYGSFTPQPTGTTAVTTGFAPQHTSGGTSSAYTASTLTRPPAAMSSTTSPGLLGQSTGLASLDEGKMSVAFDFGAFQDFFVLFEAYFTL